MNKTSKIPLAVGLPTLAAFLFQSHPALAGGIRPVNLTSIASAQSPIVVDGNLDDWPSGAAVEFTPINLGVDAGNGVAAQNLRALRRSANIRTAYDAQYLYMGIEWSGKPPSATVSGAKTSTGIAALNLHISTDRLANLRFAPLTLGKQRAVRISYGDESQDAAALGVESVVAIEKGQNRFVQEIRIPWKALSASGGLPASAKLSFVADFQWRDISPAMLAELPATELRANTSVSLNFLTSAPLKFKQAGYIGNPADWGDLVFAGTPRDNQTDSTLTATGASTMNAAPATVPPVVDGDLKDWSDASFQTAAFFPGYTGSRYSAKLAVKYDANNIYFAAKVNSTQPIYNPEPQETGAGYLGGDCLQIRLNNGQQTANLCAWYDSKSKSPALTVAGDRLPSTLLLSTGGREAFVQNPGQGYVQEIAVPWKSLNMTPPAPDSSIKATFQLWWAGIEPQFSAFVDTKLAPRPVASFAYTLPVESDVTLGVFDPKGKLLRWLVTDAHRRQGKNVESWNGLDQWGKPIPAGSYTVKGIYHPPIGVSHVLTFGNPGTPPWPTADGKGDWLSDEAAPQGAVSDGTNVYLASPGSEKGYAIIGVGPDGKRIWGFKQASSYPRCVSLALDGNLLYALFSGPMLTDSSWVSNGKNIIGRAFLICLDKTTGRPASFTTKAPSLQVAKWPYATHWTGLWDLRANKTFSAATYGGQPRYSADDYGEPTNALGIAATGGKLYISLFEQNQLSVLDAATGAQLDTIPVAHPVGVTARPDGTLLVVSDQSVVSLNPATKVATPLITSQLVAPHDITTDKAGRIYVSDWATSFQVKQFSPTGTLIRAIGKAGGRPWVGKWDANGMLVPRGVAVTNDGKLWVAEDDSSPNRISVWNTASGNFLREYIGPSAYGGGGFFWGDPQDPSTFFAEGAFFHVDTAKKTWTPTSIASRRMSQADVFSPNGMFGLPGSRTVVHDGKTYVFFSNNSSVFGLVKDGDRFRPVAAIGCAFLGDRRKAGNAEDGDLFLPGNAPAFFGKHEGQNFAWSDTNGDGQVQENEVQWEPSVGQPNQPATAKPRLGLYWGSGTGPDGSIYTGGWQNNQVSLYRFDIQSWTPSGAPVYDLAGGKKIIPAAGDVQGTYVNSENRVFVIHGYERSSEDAAPSISCYSRDGELLWDIPLPPGGKQQPTDIQANGIIGEINLPGVGSVLATWQWHGNYKPYLFTSDGLFVSTLLDETVVGPTATWDESYKHFYQAANGPAYLINGGTDSYHLLKINGVSEMKRFTAPLLISAAQSAAATQALTVAASAPPQLPQPIIHVAWDAKTPVVDGNLDDWDMGAGVALQGAAGRSAHAALKRDAQKLYLAYQVEGSKFVNGGTNPQTLFTTGDCVDLMLATGENGNKSHFTPQVGDKRLLVSLYKGKPIAVLYEPVVPGTAQTTRLMNATIDRITQLNSAAIAFKRSATGYTLEVSVPFVDLGISPTSQSNLTGDVGVIYADATGSNRAQRVYYYNHDTAIISDLTTEARLQPGNWGTLEMPLGKNLLSNGDFGSPLAADQTQGWKLTASNNGAEAVVDNDSAYAGTTGLLLRQTAPVVYPAEAFKLPNFDDFLKTANGGKGKAYAEVSQEIPVVGGKNYSLRYHLAMLKVPGEQRTPGDVGRGYGSLLTWVHWIGPNYSSWFWVQNKSGPNTKWETVSDARFNNYDVPTPYPAPKEATSAVVQFQFNSAFADKLASASVDDVEFVERP